MLTRDDVAGMLRARDAALEQCDPRDRSAEILAQVPFALS